MGATRGKAERMPIAVRELHAFADAVDGLRGRIVALMSDLRAYGFEVRVKEYDHPEGLMVRALLEAEGFCVSIPVTWDSLRAPSREDYDELVCIGEQLMAISDDIMRDCGVRINLWGGGIFYMSTEPVGKK